jgi:BolA protein
MQETIETKLKQAFDPVHLQVDNETTMHNVPPDAESHYKVIVVSEQFNDQSLIKRHRMVNAALADEISRIHALALHTYTPDQWFERSEGAPSSPPCEGGGKS